MNNASYVNLARQSGLMKEMQVIANNMANINTTGYKREGAIFSEYIASLDGLAPQSISSNDLQQSLSQNSLSMGRLSAHASHFSDGAMRSTGGSFDVAIQGDGFFLIKVGGETQLTRAGHFLPDATGLLMTHDGFPVLDTAQSEIQIPSNSARIDISGDGVISADGNEIAKLGVGTADPLTLTRTGNNNWTTQGGIEPVLYPQMAQGFLEDSNVEPVIEMARMIEVQRFYDAGQKLLEMEDQRIKQVITTIRQSV